jgi:pSer/pThr/pTyr-binding forkhead associated (FHA) protein
MQLMYKDTDGKRISIELTTEPISIGRTSDSDIQIVDEKASRLHCGIRCWDGEYFLKDLNSKNGTFLNNEQISDIVQLHPGDIIRVGTTTLQLIAEPGKGTETIIQEVQDEMKLGKGYNTILREIVQSTDHKKG